MSAAIENLNNLADRFMGGPVAHALNTLTLGAVDNREQLLIVRNARGDYVSNTTAEREYRTNQAVGDIMAGAAGAIGTVGFMFGRARISNNIMRGVMTLGTVASGYTLAAPMVSIFANGSGITNKLVELDAPLISNVAAGFAPQYLEADEFYADGEASETAPETPAADA